MKTLINNLSLSKETPILRNEFDIGITIYFVNYVLLTFNMSEIYLIPSLKLEILCIYLANKIMTFYTVTP
jgi:hypothetical protein